VRKDWEEHLSSFSQAFFLHPFLKGNLAGDAGEQSTCRHRQLSSLAVSSDNEELSLPGSSRRHTPHQEGMRSSSPYPDPASGSIDTSFARS
jgi:hypothetical protein